MHSKTLSTTAMPIIIWGFIFHEVFNININNNVNNEKYTVALTTLWIINSPHITYMYMYMHNILIF